MLVVTRQQGQEVVVGDPKNPLGVIRIAQIRGDRVRIAFDFPKHVQINRREVADQKAGDPTPACEVEIKLTEGQSIKLSPGQSVELPAVIGTIRPKTAAGG